MLFIFSFSFIERPQGLLHEWVQYFDKLLQRIKS